MRQNTDRFGRVLSRLSFKSAVERGAILPIEFHFVVVRQRPMTHVLRLAAQDVEADNNSASVTVEDADNDSDSEYSDNDANVGHDGSNSNGGGSNNDVARDTLIAWLVGLYGVLFVSSNSPRSILVFFAQVRHAEQFVALARSTAPLMGENGKLVDWYCVHSGSSSDERQRVRELLEGEPDPQRRLVVCNVQLFGEGVDLPGLQATCFLRNSTSEVAITQAIGRAVRVAPNKTVGRVFTIVSEMDYKSQFTQVVRIAHSLMTHHERVQIKAHSDVNNDNNKNDDNDRDDTTTAITTTTTTTATTAITNASTTTITNTTTTTTTTPSPTPPLPRTPTPPPPPQRPTAGADKDDDSDDSDDCCDGDDSASEDDYAVRPVETPLGNFFKLLMVGSDSRAQVFLDKLTTKMVKMTNSSLLPGAPGAPPISSATLPRHDRRNSVAKLKAMGVKNLRECDIDVLRRLCEGDESEAERVNKYVSKLRRQTIEPAQARAPSKLTRPMKELISAGYIAQEYPYSYLKIE